MMSATHCPAIMDQQHYLLSVPELLGGTGIYRTNKGSSNVETASSFPPFAREITQVLTVHCKVPTYCAWNLSIKSSNLTGPSSSGEIVTYCRSNLTMNFDIAL